MAISVFTQAQQFHRHQFSGRYCRCGFYRILTCWLSRLGQKPSKLAFYSRNPGKTAHMPTQDLIAGKNRFPCPVFNCRYYIKCAKICAGDEDCVRIRAVPELHRGLHDRGWRNPCDNRLLTRLEGSEYRRFNAVFGQNPTHTKRHILDIGRETCKPGHTKMPARSNQCGNRLGDRPCQDLRADKLGDPLNADHRGAGGAAVPNDVKRDSRRKELRT